VYLQEGRYKKAEEVLKEALDLDEKTGNVQHKVKDLNLLGNVYFCDEKYDKARNIFKSLIRIYKILDKTEEISRLRYSLYLIRMQKKKPDKEKLPEKTIEEIKKECREIKKIISEHDLSVHRRIKRLEFKINEIKEYMRDEHMDLVKEVQNLNELQLKDFENIIQEKLDQIQDVNVKNTLESRWQKVTKTLSMSADFLTLVSSAITIYNAVSGHYDIASSVAALQTLVDKIKNGV
ncbi:MAG: tetratricopeptide repeat protein, partial [Candidatus Methanofastidiosia archaeon]